MKRGIGNRVFYILGIILVTSLIIYMITPVKDDLIEFVNDFPFEFNPLDNAPQATLIYLSTIAPNYFTTCDFQNKIYYIDESNTKRPLGFPSYDPVPFKKLSITTEQTNRKVIKFTGEVWGGCKTKSTFESLVPTISSGSILVEVTATDSTGSTIKAYSKRVSISGTTGSGHNVQGKDFSKDTKIFEFEIPASEIESKLTKTSTSYKSLIKIKPNTQLEIYFKGDKPENKWTVGGQTTTSLRAVVTNDQFSCGAHCKVISKEIQVKLVKPSDGIAEINDRRVTFAVTLPEWTSAQGNPSFLIKDDIGLSVITESKLVLTRTEGKNGIFIKSVLLPEKEGDFELVVRQEQRNTSTTPIQIVKSQTQEQEPAKNQQEEPPEEPTCKSDEVTKEISGIIICASPFIAWFIDNWLTVTSGFIVFIIIIMIIAAIARAFRRTP